MNSEEKEMIAEWIKEIPGWELEKLSANEMIDDFIVQCEKEAEKLEITVDY